MSSTTTLAVDFGSKFIGVALVEHTPDVANRPLYAATLVVEPKPLKSAVETRAGSRRLRRTRKTHKRRLRRLAQALTGIVGSEELLRFCRRRGFSYEADEGEADKETFRIPREEFFAALRREINSRALTAARTGPVQQPDRGKRPGSNATGPL
jgi:CRISPR/Cas system Type II protein with McrA/HNH and RuvC-like nuclease domain